VNFWKLLFRSWSYFRTGYGTYVAFFIGFASNIIVIYKLGIAENNVLRTYFQSLTVFSLLALAVLIPLCISAGLYHMKKSGAYAADASLSTESNPYIYKVTPGKEQEVFLPLWVATVRSLAKVLDRQDSMTTEERRELERIMDKANALLEGQYVGMPRRQGVRTFPVTESDK
jgi:hypothetical protein